MAVYIDRFISLTSNYFEMLDALCVNSNEYGIDRFRCCFLGASAYRIRNIVQMGFQTSIRKYRADGLSNIHSGNSADSGN